ncbi:MAG: DUF721 domain-containing protein [Armatimonadetes bacterium]|nr:DUF721 domain-containing protein [Armatimonadota bacterium]
MRQDRLNPLGEVMQEALRRWNLTEPALEARAIQVWPQIVGPQMARATRAERIVNGTLYITAASDAWNTEISFLRPVLLRKFRERLGEPFVQGIRARIGPVQRHGRPALASFPEEEVRRIRLDETERRRIEAAAAGEDPELSQAIRRALTREAQLRVWRLQHGARSCTRCGCPHEDRPGLCPACRLDRQG